MHTLLALVIILYPVLVIQKNTHVSKDMQGIFSCHFIRNDLNRQFPTRKGNQCSNQLPFQNFITFYLSFSYLSHCNILFPLSQSLLLSPGYYSSSAPKASDSPPSTAPLLPHVLPSAPWTYPTWENSKRYAAYG